MSNAWWSGQSRGGERSISTRRNGSLTVRWEKLAALEKGQIEKAYVSDRWQPHSPVFQIGEKCMIFSNWSCVDTSYFNLHSEKKSFFREYWKKKESFRRCLVWTFSKWHIQGLKYKLWDFSMMYAVDTLVLTTQSLRPVFREGMNFNWKCVAPVHLKGHFHISADLYF